MKHELKVEPPYYDALADGSKTFEVRKNDRGFQAGDFLSLSEWVPRQCKSRYCKHDLRLCDGYTDRNLWVRVTYVYHGDPRFGGLEPGYAVLGISKLIPKAETS